MRLAPEAPGAAARASDLLARASRSFSNSKARWLQENQQKWALTKFRTKSRSAELQREWGLEREFWAGGPVRKCGGLRGKVDERCGFFECRRGGENISTGRTGGGSGIRTVGTDLEITDVHLRRTDHRLTTETLRTDANKRSRTRRKMPMFVEIPG